MNSPEQCNERDQNRMWGYAINLPRDGGIDERDLPDHIRILREREGDVVVISFPGAGFASLQLPEYVRLLYEELIDFPDLEKNGHKYPTIKGTNRPVIFHGVSGGSIGALIAAAATSRERLNELIEQSRVRPSDISDSPVLIGGSLEPLAKTIDRIVRPEEVSGKVLIGIGDRTREGSRYYVFHTFNKRYSPGRVAEASSSTAFLGLSNLRTIAEYPHSEGVTRRYGIRPGETIISLLPKAEIVYIDALGTTNRTPLAARFLHSWFDGHRPRQPAHAISPARPFDTSAAYVLDVLRSRWGPMDQETRTNLAWQMRAMLHELNTGQQPLRIDRNTPLRESLGDLTALTLATLPFWWQRFQPGSARLGELSRGNRVASGETPARQPRVLELIEGRLRDRLSAMHEQLFASGDSGESASDRMNCFIEGFSAGWDEERFGKRARVVAAGALAGMHAAAGRMPDIADCFRVSVLTQFVLRVDDYIDASGGLADSLRPILDNPNNPQYNPDLERIRILYRILEKEFEDISQSHPFYTNAMREFARESLAALCYSEQTRGRGGRYRLREALRYRTRTNSPFMRMLILAAGGYKLDIRRFGEIALIARALTLAIQTVDDLSDVREDDSSGQPNLITGIRNTLFWRRQ